MNQLSKETGDKVSVHSTASHLNTYYVPGSVRGAGNTKIDDVMLLWGGQIWGGWCVLDITLTRDKRYRRDQHGMPPGSEWTAPPGMLGQVLRRRLLELNPERRSGVTACSTSPGTDRSNPRSSPGWVTSLMVAGTWGVFYCILFYFLFIYSFIYIVWTCGFLFYSMVDSSSNTA